VFSKTWLVVFVVPVLLQGMFAYRDDFFTPTDVLFRQTYGLPFLYHGGMWSDVFLFAPLMAYIIDTHGGTWEWKLLFIALAFGLAASYAMHMYLYVPGGMKIPEAHTHDGMLTTAGWIHLFYMTAGIAVLVLFYLAPSIHSPAEVWTVSGLLFLHFVIGTHVPFKIWVAIRNPIWYPTGPIVDLPTAFTLGGLAAALIGLSLWATR